MLRATYYAVLYTATHSGFRDVWHRFQGMASTWWASRNSKLAPSVILARREACRQCPVYCEDLDTCGDYRRPQLWHDQVTGATQPMGCGCHIKTKSKLSEATCWLDDQTVSDLRWPQ